MLLSSPVCPAQRQSSRSLLGQWKEKQRIVEKSGWENDLKLGPCNWGLVILLPFFGHLLTFVVLQVIACKRSAPGIDIAQLGTIHRDCETGWEKLLELAARADARLPWSPHPIPVLSLFLSLC